MESHRPWRGRRYPRRNSTSGPGGRATRPGGTTQLCRAGPAQRHDAGHRPRERLFIRRPSAAQLVVRRPATSLRHLATARLAGTQSRCRSLLPPARARRHQRSASLAAHCARAGRYAPCPECRARTGSPQPSPAPAPRRPFARPTARRRCPVRRASPPADLVRADHTESPGRFTANLRTGAPGTRGRKACR